MRDLVAQQLELASSDYDLRITNLARFILSKLPIKSGKLLDIGAGNGLVLKFFKERGFSVEGIELEKDQVHQMQRDFKLQGVRVTQGDIIKLRGKEDCDVVIASDVIEHIKDDDNAIERLFSFVKAEGYLVITVPAHSHLFGKRDIRWGHFRRYDKSMLIKQLSLLPNNHIVGAWYWNVLGYFAYFIFEKILQRPIREEFRYKQSRFSRSVRWILDKELRLEEMVGGVIIGLTLVVIVKKLP